MNQKADAINFAAEVDASVTRATQTAAPFVPSRAQYEQQLDSVVSRLILLPSDDAWQCIRATFRGAGTMDAVAVSMFKARLIEAAQ